MRDQREERRRTKECDDGVGVGGEILVARNVGQGAFVKNGLCSETHSVDAAIEVGQLKGNGGLWV